ncbi:MULTISPECIES: Dyp-type peroxidase [Streptomyces]|uniref:Dyp-type peroxidase n=1 Tax=Streptomyces TaxID=1883 RepID=UPI0001D05F7B|nr:MULTISPECIES: Dyp-type peroxidase [Streptomyces]MYS42386.1 Dyp-type peroxidase [Streptomyces sp. SID5998]MYX46975.1 Dyp-type peroxidase [Streptomyces sp. SID89]NED35258.1 Dyp-type peroxidase [Streptomyces sp. SID8499]EFF89345.1 dyp-type peroxidase [Streptomyces sp. e14]MBY8866946.1 Dyp-type peroxidase [Streptomyces sennicomposti]
MVEPQPVIAPPARSALFLVCTIASGGESVVRDLLPDLAGLKRSVGFRAPEAQLTCVTSIGSTAWDRLFAGPRPRDLHPFVPLTGARHHAPATPGDLLFHLRSRRMDLCFELAQLIGERLRGAATVVDEVHGFKSFDERDLLGFVDGTENPEGALADESVFVGAEDPDFAGGSYVIVQKYLHDITAWKALSVEEQERIIGRTKPDNIELPDDVKPVDSHVALNTVTDENGDERKIVRDNMPFGRVGDGEFGTYFIGYARTPDVTEQMLRNMFLGDRPGVHDRILDFSTAVTGCLFHAPSADFLDDPPAAPKGAVALEGSLGIGGLKGA